MKFLFDEMLLRLARWCRVFGIYSEYYKEKSDDELLKLAKSNNLVFVTRDVQLSGRCRKAGVTCIFIESTDYIEQLAQLVRETGAEMTFPEKMRCSSCNEMLEKTDAKKVKDQVPEDVLHEDREVWRCPSCGKAYWKGGHWKNITRVHGDVRKLLEAS